MHNPTGDANESADDRNVNEVIKGERPSFKADSVWRLKEIDAEPGILN